MTFRAMRWNSVKQVGGKMGGILIAHQVAACAGWARARVRGLYCEGRPRVG